MRVLKNLLLFLIVAGCYADTAIIEYNQKKHMVELGDTIGKALPILEKMHNTVPSSWLRPADQYYEGGKNYYIHYQRTGHVEDVRGCRPALQTRAWRHRSPGLRHRARGSSRLTGRRPGLQF